MNKLLGIEEVAGILQVSIKTVKRLPIQFSRVGRFRRYDLRDIEAYRKDAIEPCPSTSAQDRRTGTRRSLSGGIGLSEALAQHPAATQRRSTESTGKKSQLEPENQNGRA